MCSNYVICHVVILMKAAWSSLSISTAHATFNMLHAISVYEQDFEMHFRGCLNNAHVCFYHAQPMRLKLE